MRLGPCSKLEQRPASLVVKKLGLSLVALSLFFGASEVWGAAPATSLWRMAAGQPQGRVEGSAPIQSRQVEVDFAVLSRLRQQGVQSAPELEVSLFGGATERVLFDAIERNRNGSVSFVGRIEGSIDSHVVLVENGSTLVADIRLGARSYQIRKDSRGEHRLDEVDPSRIPPEHTPIPVALEDGPVGTAAGGGDDGSVVDLLVVYTAAARQGSGGTGSIEGLIQLGETETNLTYANSGIDTRIRVVHTEEVDYTEAGDISTDLQRLRVTNDGFLDEVHEIRNRYGADLVKLIVNGGGCGIAYVMNGESSGFASWAFSVTWRGCVSPAYAFAHEIGHNYGFNHAPGDPGGNDGGLGYSFGYKDPGRFRTVMAYAGSCSCPQILYHSNPNVQFNGRATGTSSQDNVRTINTVRQTVANFRRSVSSPNGPPIADGFASPTRIDPGGEVILDGGASRDPDGDALTYSWSNAPGNSQVINLISRTSDGREVTFLAPDVSQTTSFSFDLTVSDGQDSDSDRVSVTVEANRAPNVEVGPDRFVSFGERVTLAASASDPDGDPIDLAWRQLGGPTVVLTGPDTAAASFTAPTTPAFLTFEIEASDGELSSTARIDVTVTTPNLPPTADAGSDQTVSGGDRVDLVGSGSDPEGSLLSFQWRRVSGPSVLIQGANTERAFLVAPRVRQEQVLTLELTVTDDRGDTGQDRTQILILPNQAPAVSIAGPSRVEPGQRVTLTAQATDPEGDALSYVWAQVAGQPVFLGDKRNPAITFVVPEVNESATLAFQVQVSDGIPDVHETIQLTVNAQAPVGLVFPADLSGQESFKGSFVGIALVNETKQANGIRIIGLDTLGGETGQVELGDPLPANGQVAFLPENLEGLGDGTVALVAEADQGSIRGFFLVADQQMKRLDGAGVVEPAALQFLVLPDKPDDSNLILSRSSRSSDGEANLELYDETGSLLVQRAEHLPSRSLRQLNLKDLFPSDLSGAAYLLIRSDEPLSALLLQSTARDYLALAGQRASSGPRLFSPQFYQDDRGGATTIHLVNVSTRATRATVRAKSAVGDELGSFEVTLDPGVLKRIDGRSLVSDSGTINGYVTVELRSTALLGRPQTVGVVTLRNQGGGAVLPLSAGQKESQFLQVAQSPESDFFTGLALLNSQSVPAHVTVEVLGNNGIRTGRRTFTIAAEQQFVQLLNGPGLFGANFRQLGGRLVVSSNVPIVSFVLFGDYHSEFLGAVEGQVP